MKKYKSKSHEKEQKHPKTDGNSCIFELFSLKLPLQFVTTREKSREKFEENNPKNHRWQQIGLKKRNIS